MVDKDKRKASEMSPEELEALLDAAEARAHAKLKQRKPPTRKAMPGPKVARVAEVTLDQRQRAEVLEALRMCLAEGEGTIAKLSSQVCDLLGFADAERQLKVESMVRTFLAVSSSSNERERIKEVLRVGDVYMLHPNYWRLTQTKK